MKLWRRFVCTLIGHNYLLVPHFEGAGRRSDTGWRYCSRCNHIEYYQFDY